MALAKKSKRTPGALARAREVSRRLLPKAATGIQGLDEITGGGLPRGRPTLVCGGAGCGKTVLAVEFLVRGALQFQERGVLLSFEETGDDLAQNVSSMGFDLKALVARKHLVVEHVRVDRNEIAETGDFDLEGLFIRLGTAIDSIGAKRVVLDTPEALFGGFTNIAILRAELRRLFDWLKEKEVTAVITGERGDGTLTRHGLEEYVSDCVILLDHRVVNQLTARRLRIVKYRGSVHGTDEYPFLIDTDGISVLPITSLGLRHTASAEIISSGVPALDQALGPRGFFRASTILVSGSAGTGKSSFAGHLVAAGARRGERCLYVTLEQSPSEVVRNMRSVGVQLSPHVAGDLVRFHASRPTAHGLELHLTILHKLVASYRPRVVIIDSITSLLAIGSLAEVTSMMTRLVDFLKMDQITLCMTVLDETGDAAEATGVNISSIVDSWVLLRNDEIDGERVRMLSIVKSRGMAHSSKTHEFQISDQGIEFKDRSGEHCTA
ncbi:MAG: circadian clock protein KaiC [Casimicrobiaceae bacterium]